MCARISTYVPDLNVKGDDRWIGSDWNSPTKLTKNFSANAVADYYNRTAYISTGQFAWQFEPYIPTQDQAQKTFQKIDHYDDTIDIINLGGVLRVAQLTLANNEPFAFIQDQWLQKNMLVYKSGYPDIYAIYTVDAVVQDGYYYLMTLTFVDGASGIVEQDESVSFGLFAANGTVLDVTATFPLLSSGGTAPNISVDSGYAIPTDGELADALLGYDRSIVSAAVTGTTTKTLTLTKQDGGTITASWTDLDTNLVTSVFGRTGAITAQSGDYTTDLVTEGTNKYFSNALARAAISVTATGLTYSSSTGDISLTTGYIIPTTSSYSNFEQAYNNMIVSASVTPGATNTLTLTQQDGGNITATWSEHYQGTVTSVGVSMPSAFTVINSPITSSGTIAITGAGDATQYIDGTGALQTFPIAGQAGTLVTQVRNETGATLTKGTIVYINGASGNKPTVAKAIATSDATSAQTIGWIQNDIPDNQNGYIVEQGTLTDLNTLAVPAGTQLYLSGTVAGGYTTVKPVAPIHLVYVGIVVRQHQTQGTVEVVIQNGYELDELHNVLIQSPITGDVLTYNASTSLWENLTIPEILGYTPANAATTLTINGTTYNLSANRTWSVGTVTSVAELTLGTSGTDLSSTVATGTTTPVITLNVPTASDTNRGALSSADWLTFNNKQDQLNGTGFVKADGANITYDNSTYLTTISGISAGGDLSGTYPNPSLVNSAVTGQQLFGLNTIGGGTIYNTDTILQAFGKIQNQINALTGSVIYQGTWNAADNDPTLASSTGTKGYYYIVSVQGDTNLNGITDWKVGDWAIFDGSVWQKIDNTDSVTSVNGYTGAVSLVSGDVPEGTGVISGVTNLYYTNARAIASTLTNYVSGPGVISESDTILTAIQKLNGNIGSLVTGVSSVDGTANRISVNQTTGAVIVNIASTYVGQTSITTLGTISSGTWNGTAITDTYISSASNWNTAYSDRMKWDGGSTGLVASTGRTSLGATTVGSNLFTLTNPSAITFLRVNADNTVSALSASDFRTAIGAGTGSGNISGTLSTNYISKANGTNSIANSQLYDDGSNVTIGNTTTAVSGATLTVYGNTSSNNILALRAISSGASPATLLIGASTPSEINFTAFNSVSGTTTYNTINFNAFDYNFKNVTYSGGIPTTTSIFTLSSVGNAVFTGSVTANSLKKSGGLSTQYLMADGSVSTLTNPVTGTGTTNYLPKWTSSSAIGNSLIYDNGTNLGIGTTSPSAKLDINSGAGAGSTDLLSLSRSSGYGNTTFTQTYDSTYFTAGKTLTLKNDSGTAFAHFAGNNAGTVTNFLLPTGNVGIGTTSPAYKLDVSGTANFSGITRVTNAEFYINSGYAITFDGAASGNNPYIYYNSGANHMLIRNNTANGIISMGNQNGNLQIIANGSATFSGAVTTASPLTIQAASPYIQWKNIAGTRLGYIQHNATDLVMTADVGSINLTTTSGSLWLTSSGNLGLGVTPSAWISGWSVFQNKNASFVGDGNRVLIGANWFYDGANKYIASDFATLYQQVSGQHIWYNAPSGTGGLGVSFTQAMTLNASGKLLIGTTTASGKLTVVGSAGDGITYGDGTVTNYFGTSGGGLTEIGSLTNNAVSLLTNGSSKVYITANGNVLIGTTTNADSSLLISKTLASGTATTVYGVTQNGQVQSSVTASANGFLNSASTQASAFTLTNYRHFYANQGTLGAGSAITNQYGFFVESNLTSATNNYGFWGAIPSGTNRWNLYMSGTANNYLAGNLSVGTTTTTYKFNWASGSNFGFLDNYAGGAALGSTGGLEFYTGATPTRRVRILDTGEIGINTTAPLTALTVSGNLSLFTTNQIRLYNSAKNNWTQFDSPLIGGDAEVDLKITAKTGYVYVAANGSLGINTNNVQGALDVATTAQFVYGTTSTAGVRIGTQGTTGGSLMVQTASLGSTYGSGFAVDGTYSGGKSTIQLTAFGVYSGGTYSADMVFRTSVNTTISERMRITSGGNVGIGTTSPSSKLHVYGGDITFEASTSNANLTLKGSATNESTIYFLTGSTYKWNIGTSSNDLTFYKFQGGTGEAMRITSTGNVGIGTTSPTYKLDVVGASGVEVVARFTASGTDIDSQINLAPTGVARGIINATANALAFAVVGSTKAIITSAGNVGIGTTSPSYKLDVAGSVGATAYYETSDIRFKNVLEINPKVDLSSLALIKYRLKDSDEIRYGYSAQDVQLLCGDLVGGTADKLTLNYKDIHSIKIATLEARVAELEAQLNLK